MLQFIKALADSTRLRIAHILYKNELSVNELVQIMNMGQSRVSRHLKILTEAGLLQSRRDGLWVFYKTTDSGLAHDFLGAILPFFKSNPEMQTDLKLAGQKLEERAKKTRQFFNTIAENWDDLNHDILGSFDLAGCVTERVPQNCGTAVDLGCGTGEVIQQLLPHAKKVIGVDGSAKMLELARVRLESFIANDRLSLRIGELHHLPLADQEVDFACVNLVLHHLHRPEEIFPEVWRILAPGATLFLSDFLRHEDESMRTRYGDHWLGLNPHDLCNQLGQNNFTIRAAWNNSVGRDLSLFMIEAVKNTY